MSNKLKRIKHFVWITFGRYPFTLIILNLFYIRNKTGINITTKNTDLVIEGFPRSGNTYCVAAFNVIHNDVITLSHHVHGTGQLALAHKHSVPCLLLVRPPIAAITSLVLRYPFLSIADGFKLYIAFHKSALKFTSIIQFVSFNTLTTDFSKVVNTLNKRFNTSFNSTPITPQIENKIIQRVEEMDRSDNSSDSINESMVARPSEYRNKLKTKITKEIKQDKYSDLSLKAEEIYKKLYTRSI